MKTKKALNQQIVRIIPSNVGDDVTPRKVSPASRVAKKTIEKAVPLASQFACLMSKKLRAATRTKRTMMLMQLRQAGIQQIDGWSFKDLIDGRIQANTGLRLLPNGEVNHRKCQFPTVDVSNDAVWVRVY